MQREFTDIFERVHQLFVTCPDPGSRRAGAGWSVKEILGHLVDSAGNNYQRLQRYVPGGELTFPGYDQEKCVLRAAYNSFDYTALTALWYGHNQLLFHLYDQIPRQDLESKIKVGDNPAVSVRRLLEDYFAHMVLHEQQVREIISGQARFPQPRSSAKDG